MSKEIINYTVAHGYEDSFRKTCMNLISNGWVPHAGVSTLQYGRGTLFSQAFVKYKNKEEDCER